MAKTKTAGDKTSPREAITETIDGIMEDHEKFHSLAAAATDPNTKQIYAQCSQQTLNAINGLQKIVKELPQ